MTEYLTAMYVECWKNYELYSFDDWSWIKPGHEYTLQGVLRVQRLSDRSEGLWVKFVYVAEGVPSLVRDMSVTVDERGAYLDGRHRWRFKLAEDLLMYTDLKVTPWGRGFLHGEGVVT